MRKGLIFLLSLFATVNLLSAEAIRYYDSNFAIYNDKAAWKQHHYATWDGSRLKGGPSLSEDAVFKIVADPNQPKSKKGQLVGFGETFYLMFAKSETSEPQVNLFVGEFAGQATIYAKNRPNLGLGKASDGPSPFKAVGGFGPISFDQLLRLKFPDGNSEFAFVVDAGDHIFKSDRDWLMTESAKDWTGALILKPTTITFKLKETLGELVTRDLKITSQLKCLEALNSTLRAAVDAKRSFDATKDKAIITTLLNDLKTRIWPSIKASSVLDSYKKMEDFLKFLKDNQSTLQIDSSSLLTEVSKALTDLTKKLEATTDEKPIKTDSGKGEQPSSGVATTTEELEAVLGDLKSARGWTNKKDELVRLLNVVKNLEDKIRGKNQDKFIEALQGAREVVKGAQKKATELVEMLKRLQVLAMVKNLSEDIDPIINSLVKEDKAVLPLIIIEEDSAIEGLLAQIGEIKEIAKRADVLEKIATWVKEKNIKIEEEQNKKILDLIQEYIIDAFFTLKVDDQKKNKDNFVANLEKVLTWFTVKKYKNALSDAIDELGQKVGTVPTSATTAKDETKKDAGKSEESKQDDSKKDTAKDKKDLRRTSPNRPGAAGDRSGRDKKTRGGY